MDGLLKNYTNGLKTMQDSFSRETCINKKNKDASNMITVGEASTKYPMQKSGCRQYMIAEMSPIASQIA